MQCIAVFSAGLCCALLLAGCGGPSGAASAAPEADIFPCRSAGGNIVPCPRAGRGGSFRGNAGSSALPRCACALAGAFCRCGPRAV